MHTKIGFLSAFSNFDQIYLILILINLLCPLMTYEVEHIGSLCRDSQIVKPMKNIRNVY